MKEKTEYTSQMIKMIKQEQEKSQALSKIRKYCPNCGHTVYVPKYKKKIFCDHCWHAVYYDEKEEFKDILQSKLRKGK